MNIRLFDPLEVLTIRGFACSPTEQIRGFDLLEVLNIRLFDRLVFLNIRCSDQLGVLTIRGSDMDPNLHLPVIHTIPATPEYCGTAYTRPISRLERYRLHRSTPV